jgi:hypothetical protein
MLEIGQYKLVGNSASINHLMTENAKLKSENSTLFYCLTGAAVIGGILFYCYLVSQEEQKKVKVPQLVKNKRNPI